MSLGLGGSTLLFHSEVRGAASPWPLWSCPLGFKGPWGPHSSCPWCWKWHLSQRKSCLWFIPPACLLLFVFPLLEKQGGAAPALPALSLFPSAGQEGIKGPPALAQTPTVSPALVWGSCRVPVPALFALGRLQ